MEKLPELPGVQGLYGTKPDLGADAPSPVDWWAASNAAAVTVQVLDFATGFLSTVTLPASGAATRLFPQGMAVREPLLLNLSVASFDFGFRADISYNDGRAAVRVAGGQVWTKYGITNSETVAALLGSVTIKDGIIGTLATVRTPADASALVPALVVEADLKGYNGVTSDLLRSGQGSVGGFPLTGALNVIPSVWDVPNGSLVASRSASQDGASATFLAAAGAMLLNGTTMDRTRSASAANLGAQSGLGAALVSEPGEWGIVHAPLVNVVATATRGAGAAGVRHVAKQITVSIAAGLALQGFIDLVVRDGVSGAGAILWQGVLACVASDSKTVVVPVHLVGSAATAMTVETLLAPNATTRATVALSGYDAT